MGLELESEVCDDRRLRVLVVDDRELVTSGFRLMLGSQAWVERCLSAADATRAAQLAARYEPHVALIDVGLVCGEGAALIRRLAACRPAPRIVLMTDRCSVSAAALREAGADGFLSKRWAGADIARTVRRVGLGLHVYPLPVAAEEPQLTPRELDFLRHVAEGATNREIAVAVHLSSNTVKEQLSVLYRKLGARNRAEVVRVAERQGLLA